MTGTIAVHQPNFMPWAGFWNKVANADLMVLMAGVQFDRGDYQQRCKLSGQWFTVPVRSDQHHALIRDVEIADCNAVRKMAKTLRQTVMSKRQPYGERLAPLVSLLERWPDNRKRLTDLNCEVLVELAQILGIPVSKFVLDSNVYSGSTTWNLDQMIEKQWKFSGREGRPVYLSGRGASDYLGFHSLSFTSATKFQLLSDSVSADSVVQLISMEEDPLALIRSCARWQGVDGIFDEAKAPVGSGSTC